VLQRIQKLWGHFRRRPIHALVALVLLPVIGLAIFVAWANYWSWCQVAAAERAMDQGDYERAREHLESCLRYWSGSGQVHYWMARVERSLGHLDDASEHLDKCEKLNWPATAIDLERTLLDAQQGKFTEVEGDLQVWAEEDTAERVAILEVLVPRYILESRFPAASHYCAILLKARPKHLRGLKWSGQIALANYDFNAAIVSLSQAVDLQPENDAARKLLAQALVATQRTREAMDHYLRLAEHDPDSLQIRLGLARCYHSVGQLDKSQILLDRLVRHFPTSWEVLSERGRLAWSRKNVDQAEKWWRQAVALYPYDLKTLRLFSVCLNGKNTEAGRAEAAKIQDLIDKVKKDRDLYDELAKRKLPADPRNPDLHYQIGAIFFRLGEEKTGAYWMQRAIALRPDYAEAKRALHTYYQAHRQQKKPGASVP
jgi:tetratricopeptide (TPR) repeat protein